MNESDLAEGSSLRPEPHPDMDLPPTWPKPLGITDIVLASLNLTCAGCGVVGLSMGMIFPDGLAQAYPDGYPPQIASPAPALIGTIVFSSLVQLVLAAAGTMLLMRRSVARPLHLVYAALAMLSFVASIVVQVQSQVDMTEWVKQNPGTKFAQEQQVSGPIGQIVGWTLGIVLGFLWPAFVLVWFLAIKKDASEIERGKPAVL